MKKLQLVWRALVFTARDMFGGFVLGICATVLLSKINPQAQRVVALLIPAGVLAGILKGVTRFIFLHIFSAIPSKGSTFNYPKYKLLGLWLVLLFGSLTYGYGLDVAAWFAGPLRLLRDNIILAAVGNNLLVGLVIFIATAGLGSYFYEPPYNPEECLPPRKTGENKTEENKTGEDKTGGN